jgi:hypothetical protein
LSVFGRLFVANSVLAQIAVWDIDSILSTVRFFVSSFTRRDVITNVGVARLSGEIAQNAGDSQPVTVALPIYPAYKNPKPAQPEGRGIEL